MGLTTDIEAKKKTSRIYELSSRLFPAEFPGMFTAKREVFRDWLNAKTGCDVDHIVDKHKALDAWLDKLEILNKGE